jgi:hypothetical protein
MLVRLTRHGKNGRLMQRVAVSQLRRMPLPHSPECYTAFQDVSALLGASV